MIQPLQRNFLLRRVQPRRNRKPIPRRICEPRLTPKERYYARRSLFWKYGPECCYCHRTWDWTHLTIDHIQPVSKGGGMRDRRNMVLACMGCNHAKSNAWKDYTKS